VLEGKAVRAGILSKPFQKRRLDALAVHRDVVISRDRVNRHAERFPDCQEGLNRRLVIRAVYQVAHQEHQRGFLVGFQVVDCFGDGRKPLPVGGQIRHADLRVADHGEDHRLLCGRQPGR
jgi:hypothetical protein